MRGHGYAARPQSFENGEQRGSSVTRKIAKIENQQENAEKLQFAIQQEYSETHFLTYYYLL